jgi:hypothetical protein
VNKEIEIDAALLEQQILDKIRIDKLIQETNRLEQI